MFEGLVRRAESTIDNALAKLVNRAAVAVPLLIASGFASAALTVWLVEHYGEIPAYGIMAALFTLVALVTMAMVSTEGNRPAEHDAAPAAAVSANGSANGAENPADEAIDPLDLLTPEVRSFLGSAAPMALPAVARGIGRNLPLIFILAILGFVISRFADTTGPSSSVEEEARDAATPRPDEMPADVAA